VRSSFETGSNTLTFCSSSRLIKKEEGRRKREEGRGKKEEGRRKKEEGRTNREDAKDTKEEARKARVCAIDISWFLLKFRLLSGEAWGKA